MSQPSIYLSDGIPPGLSPEEFGAEVERRHAANWAEFGPKLDAALLQAQTLRKAVGHKARERTLHSEETARASRNQLPALK